MTKKTLTNGLHGLTFEDFFPTSEVWADEDSAALNRLRVALFSNLNPLTPYQHVLAENLVELEWEKLRHRRMRDALLKSEVKERAVGALSGQFGFLAQPSEDHKEIVRDLISTDPAKRKSAEKVFSEEGISISELLATAYQKRLRDLAYFEEQMADVETRRRKLLMDYDLLKSEQATLVEDADVGGDT